VDFIAKLAALVPPPRAHLTRFNGVFAPNATWRAQLTPSGRGKRPPTDEASTGANSGHCGGSVSIVASIEEPTAIRAILAHFAKHGAREKAHYRPAPRAPSAVAA